jgi:SET domain
MFCSSPSCVKDSMKKFHKIECELFKKKSHLLDVFLTRKYATAIRFFSESIEAASTLERLETLMEDTESVTMFDVDLSDKADANFDWTRLRLINSLLPSTNSASNEKYKDVINTIVNHISEHFNLTPNNHEFVCNYILRLMLIFDRNSWGLRDKDDHQSRVNSTDYFGAMVNHSCAPNTCPVFFGAKHVHFVVKPIKKNEQIFVPYR